MKWLHLLLLISLTLVGCNADNKCKTRHAGQTIALLDVDFNTLNDCIAIKISEQIEQVIPKRIENKTVEYLFAQDSVIRVSERHERYKGYINSFAVSTYPKDLDASIKLKAKNTLDYCYQKLNHPELIQKIVKN